MRSTIATRNASSSRRRAFAPPDRGLGADRAPPPARRDPPRVAVVRERVQLPAAPPCRASPPACPRRARPPGRPCSSRGRAASRRSRARRPTGARPAAGAGTPARRSGGTSSSPSGLPTPLATLARNFVRAIPTVTARPTWSLIRARSRSRDLPRRAGDPLHPAHVQERLVDRQPLHLRRRVLEDREHRLARLHVGGEPRATPPPPAGTAAAPAPPPIAVLIPHAFAS